MLTTLALLVELSSTCFAILCSASLKVLVCCYILDIKLGGSVGQGSGSPGAKNAHNAKANVEESQRVRNEPTHALHSAHGAEHATGAVGAPHDGAAGNADANGRIHGHDNAKQRRCDKRQQAVAQDRRRASKGERGREVAATTNAAALLLSIAVSIVELAILSSGGGVVVGRHERQNHM